MRNQKSKSRKSSAVSSRNSKKSSSRSSARGSLSPNRRSQQEEFAAE